MRKRIAVIAVLASLTPAAAFAVTNPFVSAGAQLGQVGSSTSATGSLSVPQIIAIAMQAVFGVLGILALVYMAYAGVLIFTSQNEEDVKKAKKTLIYLFLGILILLIAFSLTQFVLNQLVSTATALPTQ